MTDKSQDEQTVFSKLIDDCFGGSLTKTAAHFNFSIQTAANYRDGRKVDEKVCVNVEKLKHPKYNRKTLRPDDWVDIWPELAQKKTNAHIGAVEP